MLSWLHRKAAMTASMVAWVSLAPLIVQAASALQPARLRCEFAADPLGIDVPHPRLSWTVHSDQAGAIQSAYQILVATDPQLLAADRGDLWDSGRVESQQTIHVPYQGRVLESSQQVFWKVRVWRKDGVRDADNDNKSTLSAPVWSEPATWTMGLMDERDWHGHWIVAPWESEAVLLRHEFPVKAGLKRAVAHVCGLGHFELRINGQKVGDNLLSPGWSKFDRTCLYETHDVTELLQEGDNALGVALGDGMYHTERRHRFSKFQGTFGPKRLCMEMVLFYADGSREHVSSDHNWRVSRGPVTYNDVYGGEDYDARLAESGWDTADFDDSHWENAVRLVRPRGTLRGHTASAPPIRAIEVIRPRSVNRIDASRDIVDLGQNAPIMPRIKVSGPAGSTVRLTHAEILHDDGTINRDTSGGNRGPAWWQYTKATDDPETWFPQFFYAGCRYLQIDKFPPRDRAGPAGSDAIDSRLPAVRDDVALPQVDRLEAVVVHSTAEPIGHFECSDDLFNRIHSLVRWAMQSNMMSVLTDCPHREKLGWLGDLQLNVAAFNYEYDLSRILSKTMRDMVDSQTDAGLVPNIAPEYTVFPGTFRAAAEWGCAAIVVPSHHYQVTGDIRLMRDHYPAMQKYMVYLASRAQGYLLDEGLGDWYDWGPADRPGRAQLTPPRVTATAYYYHDARLMAQVAKALGKQEDAEKYSALADEIRRAWRKEFAPSSPGRYATGSQCSLALALGMELAEPDEREACLAALLDDIRAHDGAMTTGIVGFGWLLRALSDSGHAEVVASMLRRPDKPGYRYILETGATCMTEAWDANHVASHNHYMFGQIVEWFYRYLAGIQCDPTDPGYRKITIRPHLVSDLEWVSASYQSVRGEITSRWRREKNALTLDVTVPPNTSATIYVPAAKTSEVSAYFLSDDDAADEYRSHGVRDGDWVAYRVASGRYRFVSAQ